ncbi:hypothetical protein Y032_0015g2561 [Ancylostoma ceylanicum]|uniref:Uncharacterized protein n=2 Tax=Ancylostoma ceylanicum TaxID=53326 RepID=A0A016V956_9BILA|nr:hypothetical protein Y032_0015g2561 [Ancylostoma ceylanicum]
MAVCKTERGGGFQTPKLLPMSLRHYPLGHPAAPLRWKASIGVPATLAFSKGVFEKFGLNSATSAYLSVGFPLVQMILILILYKSVLDRKILIVGGYIVAVFLQAVLLLTSFYPYLPAWVSLILVDFCIIIL